MTSFIFDERGFGTPMQRIPWSEVVAVGVRTTADGPFGEDVFWQMVLRGDRTMELPGSWLGGDAVGAMQRALPGIDSHKIIEAMGVTRERVFRLWHEGDSPARRDRGQLRARFAGLVERLGAVDASASADAVERLLAAWGGDARRYHDVEHLDDCLRELDGAGVGAASADRIELALWYHDAVYVPGAPDNEARSAAWLEADARGLGLSAGLSGAAARLVLATAHAPSEREPDADVALVQDINLSILGRDALRFLEYEYGIAEEFSSMSRWRFLPGRRRFLAGLLASPAIFRTDRFHERYEARARLNVGALLRGPRYAWSWWRLPLTTPA